MSCRIRLPVCHDANPGVPYESIIITTEIAKQIVTFAGMDARIDAIYDNLADRIREHMELAKRVDALERIGMAQMKKEEIAAEDRSCGLSHATQEQAQPAAHGDEATVKALMDVKVNVTDYACNGGGSPYGASARAILDAIRAGKVPGVHADSVKCRDYLTEIATLTAGNDDLRRRLAEAKAAHRRCPACGQSCRMAEMETLQSERDAARQDAEAARAEAEKLKAQRDAAVHVMVAGGIAIEPDIFAVMKKDLDAATARADQLAKEVEGERGLTTRYKLVSDGYKARADDLAARLGRCVGFLREAESKGYLKDKITGDRAALEERIDAVLAENKGIER